MAPEKTQFEWDGGVVSGVWHHPAGISHGVLVLGHGAGYNMDTLLLVDIADALAARGVTVVRFNFPYTEASRRAPDPQPRLEACYRAVATAVAEETGLPFLGGKSMGGRIASHLVADGFAAAGLVFLGYPLHPPGKPERIRDAHLSCINAPMLFLQGTRDPFASPELLHRTVENLPSASLVEVAGGDHSFKVRGRPDGEVLSALVAAVESFVKKYAP